MAKTLTLTARGVSQRLAAAGHTRNRRDGTAFAGITGGYEVTEGRGWVRVSAMSARVHATAQRQEQMLGSYAAALTDAGFRVTREAHGLLVRLPVQGTYDDPDLISLVDLDLSGLRAHCRTSHQHAYTAGPVPRANRDLATWHARQHHRYGSAQGHVHQGRYTLIATRDGRKPAGMIPRPLGWFTGQNMVSGEQLSRQFRAKLDAITGRSERSS